MAKRKAKSKRDVFNADKFSEYSLRSSFFVRRLRALDLWQVIADVERLVRAKNGFLWTKRPAWGIEAEAWEAARRFGIEPLLLFCHPRVLCQQPRLLLYYRTVALLSQKGLQQILGKSVTSIESGNVSDLTLEEALPFAVAINRVLSAVLTAGAEFGRSHLLGMQFAAAGATIQGSWNNAVGAEGEAAVRTILVNHLRDEIIQVVWRDASSVDSTADLHAELLEQIAMVKVLRLRQGYQLHFASEPDISLHDPAGLPLLAIEVKAGNDSAGALERLGASMKSFESDRNRNPRLKTVYVVR